MHTGKSDPIVGLSKGGTAVAKCKESFVRTLDDLVQLASLQTSLKTLDEALKVTNRRVNALEFVVMPQLANTVKYILSELDELEREDQYRIKKVKDIRTQTEEAEEALLHDEEEKEKRRLNRVAQSGHEPTGLNVVPSQIKQEKFAVDALFD